jgi:hypothetical protein
MHAMFAKKLFIVALLSVLLNVTGAYSQIGGSRSFAYLQLPASARITALGGYHSVVADNDLANITQNPSLLNTRMDNMWNLNICNYFQDIQYGHISTAFKVNNVGMFGIGLNYINYGDFVMRDDIGNEQGTFKANENTFNFTYARPFKQFNYGASMKLLFSNLESYRSTGIALDLGGSYTDSASGLGLSFSLLNVGSQVKSYAGNTEALPFEARFAITKKLAHAPFRFTLTLHNLQKFDLTYEDELNSTNQIDLSTGLPIKEKFSFADKAMRHVAIGTEFLLSDNLNIRVGYNHQQRRELSIEEKPGTVGFSWGFGLRIKKMNISYGSARYHLSGSTNMFSLSLNPSDFYRKKKSNS